LANIETAKAGDKTEVKNACVNLDFFTNQPALLEVIIDTIRPEMEESKKLSSSTVSRKCSQCGTVRSE
jgi:hypothetical protein